MHKNFLMGLIFWKCWCVALKKFKFLRGYGFFKKGFKSNGFQVVVWSQNLRFFFILGFPAKFGGFHKNWDFYTFGLAWFLKGFPAKFWGFRKIWDFHTFCLAWFLKGFPAKVFAKFEIFILFIWLDFWKDFQPNLVVFAKCEIFILFV